MLSTVDDLVRRHLRPFPSASAWAGASPLWLCWQMYLGVTEWIGGDWWCGSLARSVWSFSGSDSVLSACPSACQAMQYLGGLWRCMVYSCWCPLVGKVAIGG